MSNSSSCCSSTIIDVWADAAHTSIIVLQRWGYAQMLVPQDQTRVIVFLSFFGANGCLL